MTNYRTILIRHDGTTTAFQEETFRHAAGRALHLVTKDDADLGRPRVAKIIMSDGTSLMEYTRDDLRDIAKEHTR